MGRQRLSFGTGWGEHSDRREDSGGGGLSRRAFVGSSVPQGHTAGQSNGPRRGRDGKKLRSTGRGNSRAALRGSREAGEWRADQDSAAVEEYQGRKGARPGGRLRKLREIRWSERRGRQGGLPQLDRRGQAGSSNAVRADA